MCPPCCCGEPKDPVFSDLYLHDLEARLPHADVHRWPNAGHFVSEDAPVHDAVAAWLENLSAVAPSHDDADLNAPTTLLNAVADPNRAEVTAIVEMTGDGASVSFADFNARVNTTAAGLLGAGVQTGDRVAVMIPPGIDLAVTVYTPRGAQALSPCWSTAH